MRTIEFAILDWIQANLCCEFLDVALTAITKTADHGEVWIVLAVALLLIRKQRRYGATIVCGLLLDFIFCNLLLKPAVGRTRPFVLNPFVELLIDAPEDGSFPSGHTAVSFAVVFALKTAGSPLWKPASALASAIAFSRMYLYVHWPTDILGGILLGAAVGWAGTRIVDVAEQRYRSRKKGLK